MTGLQGNTGDKTDMLFVSIHLFCALYCPYYDSILLSYSTFGQGAVRKRNATAGNMILERFSSGVGGHACGYLIRCLLFLRLSTIIIIALGVTLRPAASRFFLYI